MVSPFEARPVKYVNKELYKTNVLRTNCAGGITKNQLQPLISCRLAFSRHKDNQTHVIGLHYPSQACTKYPLKRQLVSFGQGRRTSNHANFHHAAGASCDTVAGAYYIASQTRCHFFHYTFMANRSITLKTRLGFTKGNGFTNYLTIHHHSNAWQQNLATPHRLRWRPWLVLANNT